MFVLLSQLCILVSGLCPDLFSGFWLHLDNEKNQQIWRLEEREAELFLHCHPTGLWFWLCLSRPVVHVWQPLLPLSAAPDLTCVLARMSTGVSPGASTSLLISFILPTPVNSSFFTNPRWVCLLFFAKSLQGSQTWLNVWIERCMDEKMKNHISESLLYVKSCTDCSISPEDPTLSSLSGFPSDTPPSQSVLPHCFPCCF